LIYVQIASLVTLYLAGNYYVVQKLSNVLHDLPQDSSQSLPFGWFFWLWTLALPLVYVGLGVKKKSIIHLRLGLLLLAAAAFTFRNYYQLLPAEYVLVIVGAALLLIAIAAMKYLKTPKSGFTYVQRGSRHWANNINLESILVAGASPTATVPSNNPSPFGGGSFGGGGASGSF
jgi:NADH:ubiquinone oxidoreductase subunit 6 (subunit J)